MSRIKIALSCALLAALTGVAVQAILLLHAATVAARAGGGFCGIAGNTNCAGR